MKRLLLGASLLGAALACFAWTMLRSGFFNEFRANIVETLLSETLGYEVLVNGNVIIDPGTTSTFTVTDVVIPSNGIEDVNLAELSRLSLQTEARELLFGKPDFRELNVSGLTINVFTSEGGKQSWFARSKRVEDAEDDVEVGAEAAKLADHAFKTRELLNFLAIRSDEFTNVAISIDNEMSGFDFDFKLDSMDFDHQVEARRFRLVSSGSVNGMGFEFSTDKRLEGPFLTYVKFGDIDLRFEGEEKALSDGGGYNASLSFDSGDIGDLFAVLRLKSSITGTLQGSADLEKSNGVTEIHSLSTALELGNGKRIAASGSIADLKRMDGVDLEIFGRFYPEGNPPPEAAKISDLRLTEARAHLIGGYRAITVEDAIVKTNAFQENIDEFGPIGIGSIRKSPDGKLQLSNVTMQAGPRDAPFIRAEGRIENALEGKEFELSGGIRAPFRTLLGNLNVADADAFGILMGDFDLDDRTGKPRLSTFRLRTQETTLWSLDAKAKTGESQGWPDLRIDLASEISDTSAFLEAIGLDKIDLSPIKLNFAADIDVSGFTSDIEVFADQSNLATSLLLTDGNDGPHLVGSVKSDELRLADLQKLAAIGIEISKMNLLDPGATSGTSSALDTSKNVVIQPLVLPEVEPTLDDLLAEDGVQPLVLPVREISLEDLLAEDGVQPLVLQAPTLSDLLTLENILRQTDADVSIDVKKLSGIKGVSKISSELVASQGRVKFGPVNVNYGGGFVTAVARMDMVDRPDRVSFSGSTGGWNFGEILSSVGAGIEADGILHGNFNLSGRRGSIRQFVDTMNGTVKVNMSDGSIATSLLELAGLGVLPWLFSKEMREKRTEISCLSAPVRFNAGKASSDQIVVETRRVQVVAKGSLDWRRNSINMRAEPRPLGRPLSRSAWPVNITGKLTEPNIKPQIGGSFSRRSDGASTMPPNRKPCVPDILQLQ